VLLAFGVSMAVGIGSGLYPALRAASLNPINALRWEQPGRQLAKEAPRRRIRPPALPIDLAAPLARPGHMLPSTVARRAGGATRRGGQDDLE
jgi:hypothetical protein